MHVVHVQVCVKPECIDAFRAATIENARNSVLEAGIARFDVIQQTEDPTQFTLVECYRTPEAAVAHKTTAHYQRWRDAVAGMMARPRRAVTFSNVFPPDSDG